MNRLLALAFLLSVSFPSALRSQSINASLTGRITDPSKSVIAEAEVAAINADTNLHFETTTNASGEYYLPNLPPSPYRLEVEKPGFKKLIKPNVILHVQDTLSLDFQMTVGDVTESITVEALASLLITDSATVSTVVDRTFVEDMPLNGRSFQTLILLTPGVVVTPTAFDDQGQFSVNGQRADANSFTVDGVSANFGVTGIFRWCNPQEERCPRSAPQAAPTAWYRWTPCRSFASKRLPSLLSSGAHPEDRFPSLRALEPMLFMARSSSISGMTCWTPKTGLPTSIIYRNLPSGRTTSAESSAGQFLRTRPFSSSPTKELRLRQPATQESVVPDLASRQAAPSSMQPFLNAYSVPNGAAVGTGLAQFNASYSNPSSLDAYSIRVDHIINSRLTLFGRYNYSPSNTDVRNPFGVLSSTESLNSSVQTLTVGATELIKPGVSNEVRANYSNQRVGTKFFLDNLGGAVPPPDSVLFPSGLSSTNSAFEFLILGAGEYAQGKQATDEQRQVNLIDNLSWNKAGHQLKFGVDYRWLSPFVSPLTYGQFAEFTGVTRGPGGSSFRLSSVRR